MFIRSILIPSLIACVIAAPILFSKVKSGQTSQDQAAFQEPGAYPSAYGNPAGAPNSANAYFNGQANYQPFQQANSSFQNAPSGNPIFSQAGHGQSRGQASVQGYAATNPATLQSPTLMPNTQLANGYPNRFSNGVPAQLASANVANGGRGINGVPPGLTSDFRSAQTIILPGDANGPNLNAIPLEFIPVVNFEEVFRFDITPNWVKSRWKRVSTCPGDTGLHGLRVALVTGTQSWDLHGSLTYFFDGNQQVQRITFRGWAGDATKLTRLLTQRYGFQSQATHWAGFLLAKKNRKPTGGLLMQHPTVIYTETPVQQVAMVLELNNPQARTELSDDFKSLIVGSQQTQ
jgi:hypothetical protein